MLQTLREYLSFDLVTTSPLSFAAILSNETLINRMNTQWENSAAISFDLPQANLHEAATALREAYFDDRPLANDDFSKKQLGKLYGDAIVGFPTHRLV